MSAWLRASSIMRFASAWASSSSTWRSRTIWRLWANSEGNVSRISSMISKTWEMSTWRMLLLPKTGLESSKRMVSSSADTQDSCFVHVVPSNLPCCVYAVFGCAFSGA